MWKKEKVFLGSGGKCVYNTVKFKKQVTNYN